VLRPVADRFEKLFAKRAAARRRWRARSCVIALGCGCSFRSCWWCRRWVLARDSMLLTTTW